MGPREMTDHKAEMRGGIRAARLGMRDRLGAAGWAQRARTLRDAVLADPLVADVAARGGVIAAFASFGAEPPTDLLLPGLVSAGATVLLPVVEAGRVLGWARFTGDDTLEVDQYGIPTPTGDVVARGAHALLATGVAVMLVPALAATEAGDRLGQGGGFYDVLFEGLPTAAEGGPVRVAVVGPDELLAPGAIPHEEHDTPVDRVITA